MKQKSLIGILRDSITCDSIGKDKEGNVVFRQGFLYTHGNTAEKFRDRITHAIGLLQKVSGDQHIPLFELVDYGCHYASFRGGASIANYSHWYVKVKFQEVAL